MSFLQLIYNKKDKKLVNPALKQIERKNCVPRWQSIKSKVKSRHNQIEKPVISQFKSTRNSSEEGDGKFNHSLSPLKNRYAQNNHP